ncbi:hypothetical protein GIB67_042837 [Kingdonia uniflora]|uniref:ATP-dependent DNA helicase n=1 Tax=Kingdonia uniflora TaxID=39325 RepID=A0A7J7NSS6_9MAGN|nr:hypothetical protein GIB67_042837 [Kingdonia uniflora]
MVDEVPENVLAVPLENMSDDQRMAHDVILKTLKDEKSIRMIICGRTGTGKSTLINAIVRSTVAHFRTSKSVRIMAPTGVPAFNIGGYTIHHELGISVERRSSYKQMTCEHCRRMHEEFKDTQLIIIDEYIMLGRSMIANVDLRCRDIFAVNELFGGVSVVLMGDIRQLPPIFDSPLYSKNGNYMQIAANDRNRDRLIQFGKPVRSIPSRNNCETTFNASTDDANDLEKHIYLSVGARVMLRSNLVIQNGLVSGAMGIVIDIVYLLSSNPPNDQPLAVMVDFDNYRGPSFCEGSNVIPIPPQTVNWKTSSGTSCQRTQIPLLLCWAITFRKTPKNWKVRRTKFKIIGRRSFAVNGSSTKSVLRIP